MENHIILPSRRHWNARHLGRDVNARRCGALSRSRHVGTRQARRLRGPLRGGGATGAIPPYIRPPQRLGTGHSSPLRAQRRVPAPFRPCCGLTVELSCWTTSCSSVAIVKQNSALSLPKGGIGHLAFSIALRWRCAGPQTHAGGRQRLTTTEGSQATSCLTCCSGLEPK